MKPTNPDTTTKELTINWLLSLLQHISIVQGDPSEDYLVWRRREAVVLALVVEIMIEKECSQGKNPPIDNMINFLSFDALESLSTDTGLSDQLRSKISAYLKILPGYGNPDHMDSTIEHHDYITIGLIKIFNTKITR